MKTNITIPADLYEKLYDKIMACEFYPEDKYDDSIFLDEIEIGNFTISLCATFNIEIVDDSFDHAFGIERAYHLEVGYLRDIEDVQIYHCDEETGDEVDVTDQFDEDCFWNQFKRYGTVVKGVQIHHGDEVVVKSDYRYGAWTKMIYLYTDTRLGGHVCVKSLREKYPRKMQYEYILPATTGALSIVGKTGYYLRAKA